MNNRSQELRNALHPSSERVRAHRERIARGEFRRTISVSARQLDELERRSYLDSNDRGGFRAEWKVLRMRGGELHQEDGASS
jgi:hypothetical protein